MSRTDYCANWGLDSGAGSDGLSICDNRSTQHMRVWNYYPQAGSGMRVTVKGYKPFFKKYSRSAAVAGRAVADLLLPTEL